MLTGDTRLTAEAKARGIATVLVLGEDPEIQPLPFEFKAKYPILNRVELPENPYDVPAGTPQQAHFDRLRAERGQIGAN